MSVSAPAETSDANVSISEYLDKGISFDLLEHRLEEAVANLDIKELLSREIALLELKDAYIQNVLDNSEYKDTIDIEKASNAKFEKMTPEETAEKREEFDRIKEDLKRQWEIENGREWPKYKEDVYSSNGKLIRRAGADYDAHHIQPLGMGGKNEAGNITPLHANCHYDKQGVHSPDSPYSKLEKALGGNNDNN